MSQLSESQVFRREREDPRDERQIWVNERNQGNGSQIPDLRSEICDLRSPHRFSRFEQLFRCSAHPVVFREIHPTHDAIRVDQKLSGSGNVVTFLAGACVDQIVAPNYFNVGIGEKRECVSRFLGEVARLFRRIDADCNWANAYVR